MRNLKGAVAWLLAAPMMRADMDSAVNHLRPSEGLEHGDIMILALERGHSYEPDNLEI